MSDYKKKLVLTFLDKKGRKRNIHVSTFIEIVDPEAFATYLNNLPALDYVINPKQADRQLVSCETAKKIETTRSTLFKD